jgi:hypothetical protein
MTISYFIDDNILNKFQSVKKILLDYDLIPYYVFIWKVIQVNI